MQNYDTKTTMITCNDHGMTSCNEVIHTSICNDSKITRLDKNDWWYLVNQLEKWGVFKPRACTGFRGQTIPLHLFVCR